MGLTCAYTLAKQGKSVIVLEQGALANGQTARTTAHLTSQNWLIMKNGDHTIGLFQGMFDKNILTLIQVGIPRHNP